MIPIPFVIERFLKLFEPLKGRDRFFWFDVIVKAFLIFIVLFLVYGIATKEISFEIKQTEPDSQQIEK